MYLIFGLVDGIGVRCLQVYIEYVLIDNVVIDYLLLKYTFLLTRSKSGFWRLLFCAVCGAAFAAVMPLLPLPFWLSTVIKVVFSLFLVGAGAKFPSIKSFIISFTAFNLYTFLLGGGVIGIFNLFALPLDKEYSVGLIIGGAYLIIKLVHKGVTFFYRKRAVYSCLNDCEITLGGVTVKATGFFDTGNRLYGEGNTPVIICSPSVAYKLTDGFKNKIAAKYITVATAVGVDKLPVFKIDEIKIYNGDKANIYNNVMLGISKKAFKEDGYELILHSEFNGGALCSAR